VGRGVDVVLEVAVQKSIGDAPVRSNASINPSTERTSTILRTLRRGVSRSVTEVMTPNRP
jgi:hypothetical protein